MQERVSVCVRVCECVRERGREQEGWREKRRDGGREEGFNPAWIMV